MLSRILFTLIRFLFISLAGLAPISATMAAENDRLKIGLVLSGGGARGAAHVGVLKVLERERIPIDFIAGTSMGSIVGGLYASGMTATEIEAILVDLDWDDILDDNPSRTDKQIIRKQTEEVFSIEAKPGFRDGKILLPQGLIQGQKVMPTLQEITSHVMHITDFSELPIPFHAVATDIVTGDMVVLKGGELALAMRASMAVPSIFNPTVINDVMLVDGGITNNLPVDIARAMGADVIIAVDISTPYRTKDEIENILHITDQLTRILTGVNTGQRLAMLQQQDVLIRPQLGDISSGDFDRAGEAIPIGEEEAKKHLVELRKYSLPQVDFDTYFAARNQIPATNDTINSINLNNTSGLDDRIIERFITTTSGQSLDTTRLEMDLYNIHSLGNFQSVSYRMDHTPDGIDLYLDAAAKSWGPNYLYLGMNLNGNLEGDTLANFQLGYSREEINPKGGIWTSYITFGTEPEVDTRIYQPLTYELGPFFTANASISRANQAIYDDDHKFAEYRLKQSEVSAGLGWEFSHQSAVLLGVDRITGYADVLIGDRSLPEPDYDDGGVFVQYRYDSLDERDFPSSGSLISIWGRKSLEAFGADADYRQWRVRMGRVFPFGDYRLMLAFTGGTTSSGDSTIAGLFQVGGGPTLMGLEKDQILGQHMAVAQAFFYKEYRPLSFLSGYIGALLEYGGAWSDRDDISADNSIGSGSLFVVVSTPVGPLQFGVGATDTGQFTYYTRMGHMF